MLREHIIESQTTTIHVNAETVAGLMDPFALARHHDESGEELNTPFDASVQTGLSDAAKPYCRMYVMQIARFFAHLMADLTYAAHVEQRPEIPHLSDFYRIFNNEDRYFRSRRTWRIQ